MAEYKKHRYSSIHDRDLINAIYRDNECCGTCIEFNQIPADLQRGREVWGFCPQVCEYVRDDVSAEECDMYEASHILEDIVEDELASLAGYYRAESAGDMMREERR